MCPITILQRNTKIRDESERLINALQSGAGVKMSEYLQSKSTSAVVEETFHLLRRKTLALLSHESATIEKLKDIEWIETKRPGVYFCISYYETPCGETESHLYIGCAWSSRGGLKIRKQEHMRDFRSVSHSAILPPLLTDPQGRQRLSFPLSTESRRSGWGIAISLGRLRTWRNIRTFRQFGFPQTVSFSFSRVYAISLAGSPKKSSCLHRYALLG